MGNNYLVMAKVSVDEDSDISELEQALSEFSEESDGVDIVEVTVLETDSEFNIR